MVPKIRGKFEAEIVIWRNKWGGLICERIERTIPLHFRPLRADEIESLLWEFENGIIDARRLKEKMVDLALDEKEMCELGRFRVFQFLDEHLSMAAKNAIYEWIETVSEHPPKPRHGDIKMIKGRRRVYDRNRGGWVIPYKSIPNRHVKCEYCDSWIDTTHINCPNCGAPIKRR